MNEEKMTKEQEIDANIKELFASLAKKIGRDLTQDEKNKILLAMLIPGTDMKEVFEDILGKEKGKEAFKDIPEKERAKEKFHHILNYRWTKREIRKKGLLHKKEIEVVVPRLEKINEDSMNYLFDKGPTELLIDILKTDCELNNMEIQNLMVDQEFVDEMSQKAIDQLIDERLKLTRFIKDEVYVMIDRGWGKDALDRLYERRKINKSYK